MASPTRRAPRCSSSSWRPSAGNVPGRHPDLLPAPFLGQRRLRRLPRCARGVPQARYLDDWAEVWLRHRVAEHHRDPLDRAGRPHRQHDAAPDRTHRPPDAAAACDDHRARGTRPGRRRRHDPGRGHHRPRRGCACGHRVAGARVRVPQPPRPRLRQGHRSIRRPWRFAREHCAELDDPLLRQIAWSSLWDMVRDGRLRSIEYLAMVREQAPARARRGRCWTPSWTMPSAACGASCRRADARPRVTHMVATGLAALRAGDTDDDQRLWLRLAIAAVGSDDDLAHVAGHGSMAPGSRMTCPSTRRCAGSSRCAQQRKGYRVPTSGSRQRRCATGPTAVSDNSSGPRSPARTAASKAEAWRRIHGEGYGSDYLTRAALSGFQWHNQRELLVPFREPFFEQVRRVYQDRDLGFARSYLGALFPAAWAEPDVLERGRALLRDLGARRGAAAAPPAGDVRRPGPVHPRPGLCRDRRVEPPDVGVPTTPTSNHADADQEREAALPVPVLPCGGPQAAGSSASRVWCVEDRV